MSRRLISAELLWLLLVFATPTFVSPVSAHPQTSSYDNVRRTTTPYVQLGRSSLIVVALRLNGTRQARFAVDTGSSASFVSEECVKSIGLEAKPHVRADGTRETDSVLRNLTAKLVRIPRIEIGGMPLDHVPFFVLPAKQLPLADLAQFNTEPLDGLLGFNVLQFFAILIDPQRRELTLDFPGNLDDKSLSALGMKRAGRAEITVSVGSSSVSVRINGGVDEALLIDTGSEHSTISNRAAKLLSLKDARHAVDQSSVYGDFAIAPAKLKQVNFGTVSLDNPEWYFALKDDKRLPARIGQDVFTTHLSLFDFPGRKIYLAPPSVFR